MSSDSTSSNSSPIYRRRIAGHGGGTGDAVTETFDDLPCSLRGHERAGRVAGHGAFRTGPPSSRIVMFMIGKHTPSTVTISSTAGLLLLTGPAYPQRVRTRPEVVERPTRTVLSLL